MKLYNGIPLPALPGYNKSVYTHGFIQYGGVAGMESYSLIVSTASGVMGDSYTVGEHTYSAWVVAANETAAENLSGAYPGISTKEWLQFEDGKTVTASTYDNIVWSDFDILKADGSVYLKASKPYDLDAFKNGLSLGLCGKALPWKAEPVAWLYGHVAKEGETPTHTIDGVDYVGVVLPKLPVWNETAYPYAVITARYVTNVDSGAYILRLVDRPFVPSWTEAKIDPGSAYIAYRTYTDPFYEDTAAWGAWEFYESGTADDSTVGITKVNAQWANTDIVDAFDSIICPKFEPIPIYE